MASPEVTARRRAAADAALAAHLTRLGGALPDRLSKDPGIAAVERLEAVVAFLTTLPPPEPPAAMEAAPPVPEPPAPTVKAWVGPPPKGRR